MKSRSGPFNYPFSPNLLSFRRLRGWDKHLTEFLPTCLLSYRYSYWKTVFGESISSLPGVSQGFKRGLDLMNQAMALGPLAPTKLSRPDTTPLSSSRSSSSRNGSSIRSSKPKPSAPSSRPTAPLASEITFRSIAEDYVAQQDLIWVPTGRSDVNTGNLLFRVSKDGRNSGGVVCYVSEDAVYVPAGGEGAEEKPFVAVTLEELVRRAKK
jgi:tuftelin-interacting protein 11